MLTAAVPGRDKLPSPTLHSQLWPRKSKQVEATHKTFTSCCKQPYPIFLPGCCSPCAFPSPLVVGQVLCCVTLPKLVLPSLLWLRRRKEAGGQTALQSSRLLGRRGSSGAGWGRELPSVCPKCHFWSRASFKNRDQLSWSFEKGIQFSTCSHYVPISPEENWNYLGQCYYGVSDMNYTEKTILL